MEKKEVLPSPYIDFHTHASGCERVWEEEKNGKEPQKTLLVQSLMYSLEEPHPRANAITIGIHPMQENALELIQKPTWELEEALMSAVQASSKPVIALGECGWDKRSPLSQTAQEKLVDVHISIAKTLNLPIVIHNVGRTHLLLARARESKGEIEWWLHGFRGKPEEQEQLERHGIYISYHPFNQLPPHYPLMLESDEVNLSIQDHYQRTADLMETSLSSLRESIYEWFSKHFPL